MTASTLPERARAVIAAGGPQGHGTAAMWLANAKALIRRASEPRRRERTRLVARRAAARCLDEALVAREVARLLAEADRG